MSAGPFLQGTLGKCDATDPLNVNACTVVETMNDGTAGRTFTNTGANTMFMFKREPVPKEDLPESLAQVAAAPAAAPAAPAAAAVSTAAAAVPQQNAQQDAQQDAEQDAEQDAPEQDANLSGGEGSGDGGEGEEKGDRGGGAEPPPSPPPSPRPSPTLSPNPSPPSPKTLEPGVSCGATLPLDDLPDSCSSDAPPPPLKAYILSILNPILEEYADALFQTLRVKPYQLAESAVSDAVIAQAITPEVLQRIQALNDPAVQKVLADFKANVKKAVQQSGEMLQNGLGDNIGNLLGNAVRQFTNGIKYAVADIPGWGFVMSGVQLADAAVDAAKQGEQIVEQVKKAVEPLNAVQAQVSAVTDAVDKATGLTSGEDLPLGPGQEGDVEMSDLGPESGDAESETEAKSGNVSGKGAELEMMPMGASAASPSGEAEEESTPALGTPARRVGPQDDTFATPQAKNPEDEERLSRLGGGSRKRRRIHKLSRRIERTLRRVQKKYGLQSNQGNQDNQDNQDKNGFLRRTLRHRKH